MNPIFAVFFPRHVIEETHISPWRTDFYSENQVLTHHYPSVQKLIHCRKPNQLGLKRESHQEVRSLVIGALLYCGRAPEDA